jgi:hypothetical protein
LLTQRSLALYALVNRWRDCLPETRHARATLQELANIADFAEKKAFDFPRALKSLGEPEGPEDWCRFQHLDRPDFYPTIISWLSKEVRDMVFTRLSG